MELLSDLHKLQHGAVNREVSNESQPDLPPFSQRPLRLHNKLERSADLSKLRTLLKQRNKLIHNPKYKIDNRRFQSLASKTIRELQGKNEKRLGKKAVVGLGIAATAAGFVVNKILKR
jgi:hypothetical protein